MSSVFADTSFFIALVNPNDEAHSLAKAQIARIARKVITSEWIVCELGNALSSLANRELFVNIVKQLRNDPQFEIVQVDSEDLLHAIELFGQRRDKEWSLIDCLSFDLMSRKNLIDALTTDHHFVQAGYNALLIP